MNISGVTIKNGEPPSNFSPGGGIYIYKGSLSIHNSNVSNNKARIRGAGISNAGVLRLFQSTVRDNEITGLTTGGGFTANGGGIFNFPSGTVEINRSTVSGNRATGGWHPQRLPANNQHHQRQRGLRRRWHRNESGTALIAFRMITNNVANLSAPDENVAKRTGLRIQNLGTVSVGNTILAGNNDNRVPSDSFFSPDCFSPTQSSTALLTSMAHLAQD